LLGVTVNEVQGSPFQVDVNYRGQRLSPLLGTAQGLSLYLDGMRLNQPFGDVVNWNLLPEAAISGLALVPGSNPLYGLNTLGGALVLTTKSGLSHPGTTADVSFGSAGRKPPRRTARAAPTRCCPSSPASRCRRRKAVRPGLAQAQRAQCDQWRRGR